MRLSIEIMRIKNFKGTRDLTIDFSSTKTSIHGCNGTGKTTIPDAFAWVLWNKDSHGNAPGSDNFREKPLDVDGKEIHNLDTEVELICRLDGQPFNLRRVQRENWVKKRGNADATYQGNVSTYWINDVETKMTDFKARIAQITSEEVFRLIGSLSAFNMLDWKKRREQLLSLSGIDVDAELLRRDEYRQLADECAQRGVSVEDLRKIMADQKKRTNTDMQMLPVRIDEARKALPTFGPHEIADAEYRVKQLLSEIESIDGYIAEARSEGGLPGHKARILALETEMLGLQRAVSDVHRTDVRKLEDQRDIACNALHRAIDALEDVSRRMDRDIQNRDAAMQARDALRVEYNVQYERKFVPPVTERTCPTCGQDMPSELIQIAIDTARQTFDDARRAILADIKKRGTEMSVDIERLDSVILRLEHEQRVLNSKVDEVTIDSSDATEKLQQMPKEPDYGTEPRIDELQRQIEDLRRERTESPDEKVSGLERRKAELNAALDRNRATLARRDAGKETERRIADLEQQQKDAAARISDTEQLIAKIEQFIQGRCLALEESINNRFPTLRWKLFDIQINGGIVDCCQAMIPCESGLVSYESANTASQLNADVEIINVLSKHYSLSLPLFIDNSERVNRIADTDAQLVTLAVTTDSDLIIVKEDS